MRLFIALTLPEAFLLLLDEAGAVFSQHAHQISRTKPDNLHLTLRFLGDVGEEQLPGLRQVIRALPSGGSAALSHYGSFPAPGGLTLWAGLDCDAAALSIARAVEAGVRALGFVPETRPFVPHVTLARRAKLVKPLSELVPLLPLHKEPLPLGPVTLYQSVLEPTGPKYWVLERSD